MGAHSISSFEVAWGKDEGWLVLIGAKCKLRPENQQQDVSLFEMMQEANEGRRASSSRKKRKGFSDRSTDRGRSNQTRPSTRFQPLLGAIILNMTTILIGTREDMPGRGGQQSNRRSQVSRRPE